MKEEKEEQEEEKAVVDRTAKRQSPSAHRRTIKAVCLQYQALSAVEGGDFHRRGLSGMDGWMYGWREVWLADRAGDGGKEGGVSGVERGSADGVGSPGSPGAPGVAGNSGTHGQAQRQRRLQWSQTATGVTERRHFSLE